MPDENDPFDAAMQKLSRLVQKGVEKLHPAKPAEMEAVHQAVRRQFEERPEAAKRISVATLCGMLAPALRSVLSQAIRSAAVAHPSPEAVNLLTWNVVVSVCATVTPEDALPYSRRRLQESGRLNANDLSAAREEFQIPLPVPRSPDPAAMATVVRSVLEIAGLDTAAAERAASEIVPIIVRQVENAPMDSPH
jgi:hypothetical protein